GSKPAAPNPTAATMSAEQRLEMNTQIALLKDAWAKEAGRPRNRALAAALLRPAITGEPTSDQLLYWQIRALSALELDVYQLGWEAGAKLRALGALDSTDAKLGETMAALNSKGWLTATL